MKNYFKRNATNCNERQRKLLPKFDKKIENVMIRKVPNKYKVNDLVAIM